MLIRLKHLDEREFASTMTPLENQWGWIQDCVAFEFECDVEDVSCIETEDDELIAVRDVPVARVIKTFGWAV